MKTGVLGTGPVGQTLSSRFVDLGYEVMMGTREVRSKLADKNNGSRGEPPFSEWHRSNSKVRLGTFAEAAHFGEVIVNATNGANSLEALKMAGEKNLSGKVLIDVSNPLDFSSGSLALIDGLNNTNSLGEQIQKDFPGTNVVKTFNTMWCGLMVNPSLIGNGNHINFISGNSTEAKAKVKGLLKELGWSEESIFDLGDITAARATEAYLPLWIRVMGSINSGVFNFRLVW